MRKSLNTRFAVIQAVHFHQRPIWHTGDYYFYVPLSLVAVISDNYGWPFILILFFFTIFTEFFPKCLPFCCYWSGPPVSKCQVFKGVSVVEYLNMILLKKERKLETLDRVKLLIVKRKKKKSCLVSNKWTRWLLFFLERVAEASLFWKYLHNCGVCRHHDCYWLKNNKSPLFPAAFFLPLESK